MQNSYPLHAVKFNELENKVEILSRVNRHFICKGILKQKKNGYVYLQVDDNFVYHIFPLISLNGMVIPDYFSEPEPTGAHISVFYEEEINSIKKIKEIGNSFEFHVIGTFSATIQNKNYAGLLIKSEALEELRKKYSFSAKKLLFKGIEVPFHLTVASSIT